MSELPERCPKCKRESYIRTSTGECYFGCTLPVFYDIKLKGWNCRACRVFNGEELTVQHTCRSCAGPRPTWEESTDP